MKHQKVCTECGEPHWTEPARCPACHGVREFHRHRLTNFTGVLGITLPFSQRAFEVAYGPEQ